MPRATWPPRATCRTRWPARCGTRWRRIEGDVLAFLPGMGEIRRTHAALAGCGALVLPLHGDLPPAEQDRALRPAEGRRVVLATSIAETSLTVPGVRVVVDGGWRRTPRLDGATGLTRLTTLRDQPGRGRAAGRPGRAGSAGRRGPAVVRGAAPRPGAVRPAGDPGGRAVRPGCWTALAWGTAPEALPFPDPPPPGALAAARALLATWARWPGADHAAGRRMAELGAHPRLAAMMLAARSPPERALAADLAALLEERDPLREREHPPTSPCGWKRWPGGATPTGARWRASARPPASIAAGCARRRRRRRPGAAAGRRLPRPHRAAPGRGRVVPPVRRRRRQAAPARPAGPRAAAGRGARWSWALRAIRLAAPLDPADLPPRTACTETVENGFDPATGAVLSRRRRRLGALVLEDRTAAADPARRRAPWPRWSDASWTRCPGPTPPGSCRRGPPAARPRPGGGRPVGRRAAGRCGDWLAPHLLGIAKLADAAARPARRCCAPGWAGRMRRAWTATCRRTWRCRAAGRRSTTRSRCRCRGAGPGVLRAAHHAGAGRRRGAAAARAAVAGRAAGGDHGRPGRVLGRCLGRRAA